MEFQIIGFLLFYRIRNTKYINNYKYIYYYSLLKLFQLLILSTIFLIIIIYNKAIYKLSLKFII